MLRKSGSSDYWRERTEASMKKQMKNIHPIELQRLGNRLQDMADFLQDRAEYYKNTAEGQADLRHVAEQTGKAAGEAGDIALQAAKCVVRGGARRIKDYFTAGNHVVHGRCREAGKTMMNMELRRIKSAGCLAGETAGTIAAGLGLAGDCIRKKEADEQKKKKMLCGLRNCAIAGAAVFLGMEIYDGFEHTAAADGLLPNLDAEHFPGIENGVLVDDSPEHLQALTAEGELPHTEHISDVVRDPAVKAEFLQMHGFDEEPSGWEVHHIVPLSEGGADTPDNMVLLRAEDHARITWAHQQFYHWDTPWQNKE